MKIKFLKSKIILCTLFLTLFSLLLFVGCSSSDSSTNKQEQNKKNVGVAWNEQEINNNMILAIEGDRATAELLPLVKYNEFTYDSNNKITGNTVDKYGMLTNEAAEIIKSKPYEKTNVADVVKGRDAIVLPGGEDVSPSLYKNPKTWYDYSDTPEFNATRDVSDYILMSYCLDNDIPVMSVCRGMQMYAVVTGGEIIQDLPTYYASKGIQYNNEHYKTGEVNDEVLRGNHTVYITDKNSRMYECFQKDELEKPYSWHHQAVLSVDPSKSKVTAVGKVGGLETIEAIERADSNAFGLFMQFHPEHALASWKDNIPENDIYMQYEDCVKVFNYFLDNI